ATAEGPPRERIPYPLVDEPPVDVDVRVLDVDTRQPVEGAEVVFLPQDIDMSDPRTAGDRGLHESRNASDEVVGRAGKRGRTGRGGEARIRLPVDGGNVLALHAERRVGSRVQPKYLAPGERVALWLDDPHWIRVRLVDETTGAPVQGELVEMS